jgi:hypothetical protein
MVKDNGVEVLLSNMEDVLLEAHRARMYADSRVS